MKLSDSIHELFDLKNELLIEDILRHLTGIEDDESRFLANTLVDKTDYEKTIHFSQQGSFRFSDHSFVLLEIWLEKKFNLPFPQLMNKEIFTPLNLNNLYYVSSLSEIKTDEFVPGYEQPNELIPNSYSIYPFPAACGLWRKGSDLLKLMSEVIKGMQGQSELKIDQNLYQELTKPLAEKWLGLGCFFG